MGNGTKVALVALLILMVVVIARFVRDGADDNAPQVKAGLASGPTGKVPATETAKPRTQPGATDKAAEKKPQVARAPAATGSAPPAVTTAHNVANANLSRPEEKVTPTPAPSRPPATPPAEGHLVAGEMTGPAGTPPTAAAPAAVPPTAVPPAAVPPTAVPPPGTTRAGGTFAALPSPTGGEQPFRTQLETPGSPAPGTARPPGSVDGTRFPGPRTATGTGPIAPPQQPGEPRVREQGPPLPAPLPGPPAPAPPGAVPPGAVAFPLKYKVEKGDSHWAIAQKHYKNGSLWQQIEKANPGVKLQPGVEITIPRPVLPTPPSTAENGGQGTLALDPPNPGRRMGPVPPPAPREPTPSPGGPGALDSTGTTYVVQKGDTLTLIAKKFYRDSSKYHLIEDANETLRYQVLRAGDKIKIPPLKK